jgi:Bifunctional DNA primase/polymerase, N-terminal
MNGHEVLDWLYGLLGQAVLLPIELGTKKPSLPKWQAFTYEDALGHDYRQRLIAAAERGGNIGVLLGPASDRLLALDLDDDGLIKEWLDRQPWLADTLRTKGQRGCQFWLRLEPGCQYPNGKAVIPLKEDGKAVGELRLGGGGLGAQSIIYGLHPAGMLYEVTVDKPVLVVSPADLDELVPEVLFRDEEHEPEKPQNLNGSHPLPVNLRDRVIRYLDKCEPAVSGKRGHDTTFRVLCNVIGGFDLSPEQTWVAAVHYNERCEPPWSEKELRHKVDDALKATSNESRGHLLESENDTPFSRELKKEQAQREEFKNERGGARNRPQLILPSGEVSISESAEELFEGLSKTRRYFVRGRVVMELAINKDGNEILTPLRATALRSRIEESFRPYVWRSPAGEPVLKPTHCPKDIAEAFLETDAVIECLPGIRLLVSCPILTIQDGNLKVLNKGYHDVDGGICVERRLIITEVNLEEARQALLNLLVDFDFTTRSDQTRAVASFVAPALRFGQLLHADFPLDLAEADQSQSGKTYRQKLVCEIYGEQPYIVARRENGVGSLDESICGALLSGRPFICLENTRGLMDSQLLESAIRGHGHVNVRVPHKGEVQLSTERICWQLSSNRAATTADLANRSIITRIRKRPNGYKYKEWPEGSLLTHVKRNQAHYLSCVFSIVRAWFAAGCPKTSDSRHDFREFCQALDWIVQNLFCLPPLLDGHREEQDRISNPYLNWLRDLAVAVDQATKLDEGLRTGELVDICAAHNVRVPSCAAHADDSQQAMIAGRILNKLFDDAEAKGIAVGGYLVRRDRRQEYSQESRHTRSVSYFRFERQPE